MGIGVISRFGVGEKRTGAQKRRFCPDAIHYLKKGLSDFFLLPHYVRQSVVNFVSPILSKGHPYKLPRRLVLLTPSSLFTCTL